MHTHVGLRDFVLHSLEREPRTVHSQRKPRDMWPCPPPLWKWTGCKKPSPRRRRQLKFWALRNRVVQQIICVLNWEALGHVKAPPPSARVGAPFSPEQLAMIERIEDLVTYFMQVGDFSTSSLGRSADKLSRLLHACKELPESVQDVDLEFLSNFVKGCVDPYSNRSHSSDEFKEHEDQSNQDREPAEVQINLDTSTAKPVVSDRIKWEHSPTFDPRPFLVDPVVKEAFSDPNCMRLPENLWLRRPVARVHCSRSEVLKLAEKWDNKSACRIFTSDQICHDEAVGIFGVHKDADYDRLILNPVVINGKTRHYSNYTKSLAPCCLIGLVQLKDDEVLRISADDLAEMYYTFKVPERRAQRNSLRISFHHSELEHLQCYNPALHHGKRLYVALGALAMGDSLAVEIAQQAHHQVLVQLAGAMREHERVCYRRCFPRGPFFELLAIDDHIGLQIISRSDYRLDKPARDTEVFERAGAAYRQVGLVQHPKKKRRRITEGIFLGSEVDGQKGRVSAPRSRILLLMLCTSLMSRKGTTTPRLLACVLGSWIHILMYRRPVMSILSSVFSEGKGLKQDVVFELSRQSRNELLALSILGPVVQANLRTSVCNKVFCLDASPFGAGICQAEESAAVVSELWRHSEQKGFYTKLENPAAATLKEIGLEGEVVLGGSVDPNLSEVRFPPPRQLREGYLFDVIELFKGEGNWSLAHAEAGCSVHDGLDRHGRRVAFSDLLDNATFHDLLSLALRGVIRDWHAGPPCFTFGTLRRPRIRSKQFPGGFDLTDRLTKEQNALAWRTVFLLSIAMFCGAFISIEQPGNSVMFYLNAFKGLAIRGCVLSKFCFCAFGSAFKKPSRWLHNKPWMLEVESRCNCKGKEEHFIIEGTFTRERLIEFEKKSRPSSVAVYGRAPRLGESVASFSASYPLPLVRRIALGSVAHKNGSSLIIPISRKISTLQELCVLESSPSYLTGDLQPSLREWHQDPEWIGEMADSLPFKELLRYKFHKTGHINVLEARTHKTWLKYCARKYPNCRVLGLLDSRVTLGASAKGRSSSFAISRVLQGSLCYIIGGGLYPGGLHVSSGKNRSDAPSRNKPVPGPSKEIPEWLLSLRKGDHEPFDAVVASSNFSRIPGRWVRLLLLLCGDIERNPGPAVQHNRTARGSFDFDVGFTQATSKRMDDCLRGFRRWCDEQLPETFQDLCSQAHAAALALRAYGVFLYEAGYPRYMLTYTITGLQDAFPHFRGHLQPAWQIDKKWQAAEPGECRPVISAPIMQAMVAVSLTWRWYFWAGVSMVGYLGMLHPAEFLALQRQDLILPRDAMISQQYVYVHLRQPKTARFARKQHVKVEDPLVVQFLDALYGDKPLDSRLFPGTASTYRRQWNAVLDRLGVPHGRHQRGATPAVLRGSGATHLYLATEDLQLVQWRGRWTKQKTVEFYLQEVAAQLMLHRLDDLSRERVRALASFARHVLAWHVTVLRA